MKTYFDQQFYRFSISGMSPPPVKSPWILAPSLKSPVNYLMNRSYKRQFNVNFCKNLQTCGLQSLAFPATEILGQGEV